MAQAIGIGKYSFAILLGMLSAWPVLSQEAISYPSKLVTLVSPNQPGGTTDKDGRIWIEKLKESTGHQFVLDFKPGANTIVGTRYVAKAAPDGHTLLLTTAVFTVSAVVYRDRLGYDPIKDLFPVTLTLERPTALLVNAALPVNNFTEYLAYVRANPGKINFGTTGNAGSYHLAGAWLHGATKTNVTFVNYKAVAPLFVDLAAGRIDVAPASVFTGLPFIKSGRARPIAILSAERTALLPGLRTVAEQDIPGFNFSTWEGILAPAGTSPAIVNKLAGEFARIVKAPDVAARFVDDGTVLIGSTPAVFRQFIGVEINRWEKLVQETGIKADD